MKANSIKSGVLMWVWCIITVAALVLLSSCGASNTVYGTAMGVSNEVPKSVFDFSYHKRQREAYQAHQAQLKADSVRKAEYYAEKRREQVAAQKRLIAVEREKAYNDSIQRVREQRIAAQRAAEQRIAAQKEKAKQDSIDNVYRVKAATAKRNAEERNAKLSRIALGMTKSQLQSCGVNDSTYRVVSTSRMFNSTITVLAPIIPSAGNNPFARELLSFFNSIGYNLTEEILRTHPVITLVDGKVQSIDYYTVLMFSEYL